MALRVSGVDLVVKNFVGFMTQTRNAANAAVNLGLATEQAQRRVANIGSVYDRAARQVESSVSRVSTAIKRQKMAQDELEESTKRLDKVQQGTNVDAIAAAQKANTIAAEKLAIATNNVVIANNNLANSQQAAIKSLLALGDATDNAALGFTGISEKLVGFIPVLGKLISSGQITVASMGSMASILPVVGGAFAAAGVTIGVFTKALGLIGSAANVALGALRGLANAVMAAFRGVAGVIEWATRPLRTFAQHVVEIASGIALWRFIRNLGEAFKNLTTTVADAVAEFQGLEIRLDVLVARDYAKGLGIPMAEAFERSAGAGEMLFGWMRQLAVTTPFRMSEISNMFALSNAMGLSVDKTKEMTVATTNFAAAMNLSDEVLWRIVYNFGQMIQRGKLSGEEFRDLARNMVPIDQIMTNLANNAGMSKEAFREMALEGGVPVMDFLDEFVRIANTDYPDAAQRMARTWQGVTSNIRDFLDTFIGIDLLKPAMDRFTGRVADMLDSLIQNESLQKATKFLGQVLLRSLEILTPAVDRLMGAFGALFRSLAGIQEVSGKFARSIDEINSKAGALPEWARRIAVSILTATTIIGRFIDKITGKIAGFSKGAGGAFDSLGKKAYSWGIGFISAFSKGVSGGIKILTSVINVITKVLTTFFKPHSPPEVAPEIDVWGAETMNEWIKGFTNADFDLFKDTTSLIESYFRSLGESISKDALIPAILQSRGAVAQAIASLNSGGNISAAIATAMSGIGFGGGAALDQFRALFDVLMRIPTAERAVASATDQVSQAQAVLDEARARLDGFDDSIYGIADAEAAVAAAGQRVKDVQSEINLVTERYDSVISRLRSQLESITDTFEENNRLREIEEAIATGLLTEEEKARLENEKQQILIEQQIRATEEQRDAEVGALEEKLAAAEAEEAAAEARLESIQAEVDAKKELLEIEVERAEKELDAAKAARDRAEAGVDLLENQAEAIKAQIEALIEQNNLLNEQKGILDEIAEEEGIVQPEQPFTELEIPPSDIDAMLAEIDRLTSEASTKADEFFKSLSGIGEAWSSSGIKEAWAGLGESAGTLGDQLGRLFGTDKGGGIFAMISEKWQGFRDFLKIPDDQDFFSWLAEKIENAKEPIARGAEIIWTAATLIWKSIQVLIAAGQGFSNSWIFKEFVEFSKSFLGGATDYFKGTILIVDAIGRLRGKTDSDMSSIANFFTWWTNVLTLFNPSFAATVALFRVAAQGFDAAGDIYLKFAEKFSKFVDQLIRIKENSEVAERIERVSNAITRFLDSLKNAILGWATFSLPDIGAIGNALKDLAAQTILLVGDAIGASARARGGRVSNNRPYLVGERGPEVFQPNVNGTIFPSASAMPVSAPVVAGGSVDKSVTIEVNASYAKTQSQASIFYDIEAALASVYRR